jgi:hypothetical protein
MSSLSDIDRITKQVVESSPGENRATSASPIGPNSAFASVAGCLQVVVEIEDRSQSKILIKDVPDLLRLHLIHMQLPVFVVIT